MTTSLISILALVSCSLLGLAQTNTSQAPKLQWSKTYGYISGVSIVQVADGNLVIAADSGDKPFYAGHGGYDFTNRTGILLKIDLNGNLLWRKRLPFDPHAMIQTKDGGFAICGWTRRLSGYSTYNGQPEYAFFVSLASTDFQGNLLWNQTYEKITEAVEYISSVNFVYQTSDGGFIMGGNGANSTHLPKPYKAWLMKTDWQGNTLWINKYGLAVDSSNQNQNSINAIAETDDGGFIFSGYVDGAIVVKIDNTGNVQWSKAYGNYYNYYGNTRFNSLIRTREGDFILAGYIMLENYDLERALISNVVKLNEAFDIVWNNTYGQYRLNLIEQCFDDSYLFISDRSLIKINSAGNFEWEYNFTSSIWSATQTQDEGYALTGSIMEPNAVNSDIRDILVQRLTTKTSPSFTEYLLWIILVAAAMIGLIVAMKLRKKKIDRTQSPNPITELSNQPLTIALLAASAFFSNHNRLKVC